MVIKDARPRSGKLITMLLNSSYQYQAKTEVQSGRGCVVSLLQDGRNFGIRTDRVEYKEEKGDTGNTRRKSTEVRRTIKNCFSEKEKGENEN